MRKESGSILIFIFWALIILSLLSIAVSYNYSGDIKLAKHESDNIKALYLAKAGVAKMIAELNSDKNLYDSINEGWGAEKEFKFGGGVVTYRAMDEGARFNLNSANLMKESLILLGLDDVLSQAVLEYKAGKGEKGFEFMEELFLVEGMTRDIYLKMKDNVTIYRGNDSRVNINTANNSILGVVLGMGSPLINKIVGYREGRDGKTGTEDDGLFTENNFSGAFESFGVAPDYVEVYKAFFSVKSDFFRILVSASFSENKEVFKNIEAVAARSGKIYYWKEE